MTTLDSNAFAECEKEPLANSGLIQPNGVLLFIDKVSGQFRYASANASELLGESPEDLLDQNGRDWVEQNLPDLATLPANAGKRIHMPQALDMGKGELDLLVSATSSGWLLEFELSQEVARDPSRTHLASVSAPMTASKLATLEQSLVDCVAEVTGYDRVMLYQFDRDWSGEVLAEAVDEKQGKFLGLRFPASDIPAIARSLYAQTPYRHIPNSAAIPVPILGKSGMGRMLDLTWSDLRSVSPMHMQYLTNMHVLSSFSVSVMVDGKLWGLVACHHSESRVIPLAARERCKELAAEFVKSLLAYRKSVQRDIFEAVTAVIEPIKASIAQGDTPVEAIAAQFGNLCELAGATTGAVVVDDVVTPIGNDADIEALRAIHLWAVQTQPDTVFAVDNLPAHLGSAVPLGGMCGALGMSLRAKRLNNALVSIYLCRPEEAGEVSWAGNPNKPLESTTEGQRLSPRSSFEKWVQVRSGQSRSWGEDDVFTGIQLREQLAGAF